MKNKKIYFHADDFNTTKAHFQKIFFKNGEPVKKDDVIAVFESSKKIQELISESNGFIYWSAKEGDVVVQGEVIALLAEEKIPEKDLEIYFNKTEEKIDISPGLSFKLVKEAKGYNLSIEDLQQNKIRSLIDLENYVKLKWGIQVKKLTPEQENLVNLLSPNFFTSFVSVELSLELIKEKLETFVRKVGFEISIDVLFVYLIKNSIPNYPLINAWIFENKLVEDCNKNIGVYITQGLGNGVPIEISGNLQSIEEIAVDLFDQVSSLLKNEPLVKRPCAIYISNLTNTNAAYVIPMLKKNSSSTLVLTQKNNKLLLGISFDHRIYEGNYAISFLNSLAEGITKI